MSDTNTTRLNDKIERLEQRVLNARSIEAAQEFHRQLDLAREQRAALASDTGSVRALDVERLAAACYFTDALPESIGVVDSMTAWNDPVFPTPEKVKDQYREHAAAIAAAYDEEAGPTTQQIADSRWHELNERDAGSVGALDVEGRLVSRLVEATWLVEHGNPNWSGIASEWWRRQRAFLAAYDAERQGES